MASVVIGSNWTPETYTGAGNASIFPIATTSGAFSVLWEKFFGGSWVNISNPFLHLINVDAGQYRVTVTDAVSASTSSIVVPPSTYPQIASSPVIVNSCYPSNPLINPYPHNGEVHANVNGTVIDVSLYDGTRLIETNTTGDFTQLPFGNYTLVMRSQGGLAGKLLVQELIENYSVNAPPAYEVVRLTPFISVCPGNVTTTQVKIYNVQEPLNVPDTTVVGTGSDAKGDYLLVECSNLQIGKNIYQGIYNSGCGSAGDPVPDCTSCEFCSSGLTFTHGSTYYEYTTPIHVTAECYLLDVSVNLFPLGNNIDLQGGTVFLIVNGTVKGIFTYSGQTIQVRFNPGDVVTFSTTVPITATSISVFFGQNYNVTGGISNNIVWDVDVESNFKCADLKLHTRLLDLNGNVEISIPDADCIIESIPVQYNIDAGAYISMTSSPMIINLSAGHHCIGVRAYEGCYDCVCINVVKVEELRSLGSFTTSYSPITKKWISFHTYQPYRMFNTSKKVFSFNTKYLYKHNANYPGVYYERETLRHPSYVDIARKLPDFNALQEIKWMDTAIDVFNRYVKETGITHITIRDYLNTTGKIQLNPKVYKRMDMVNIFNHMRNYAVENTKFTKDILENFNIRESDLYHTDIRREEYIAWLITNFIIIRFEIDNQSLNYVYLGDVGIGDLTQ
jgi:hypothetical protein